MIFLINNSLNFKNFFKTSVFTFSLYIPFNDAHGCLGGGEYLAVFVSINKRWSNIFSNSLIKLLFLLLNQITYQFIQT